MPRNVMYTTYETYRICRIKIERVDHNIFYYSNLFSTHHLSSLTEEQQRLAESSLKGRQGMSANGKACYDKLDEAIVAL